jgi:hypothetical protein
VGGGDLNRALRNYASVVGGASNLASGDYAFVAGGLLNTAAGVSSSVIGGESNFASGANSLAAGKQASAIHNGAFVWSDGTAAYSSSAANEFRVRASNGAFFTNNLTIGGALSKGSGTFDIPNPDPSSPSGARLRHSFVEAPTAGDNIYRYVVAVQNGVGKVVLPSYFKYLNGNPQVWVSPQDSFGLCYGTCDSQEVTVRATVDGLYNVLVIGTRIDDVAVSAWNPTGVEYIQQ